jgi:type IX secretion system substrate protein
VAAKPNPSSGILTVELLPSSENMTIRLVNLYGQILVEKEIQTTQKSIKFEIDLTNLSNAMYLLSISDKTNSKTIKIIKKD